MEFAENTLFMPLDRLVQLTNASNSAVSDFPLISPDKAKYALKSFCNGHFCKQVWVTPFEERKTAELSLVDVSLDVDVYGK